MSLQLFQTKPLVISTNMSAIASDIIAKAIEFREKELMLLSQYGSEWKDVKDAVQTSLMWSLMYDPKLSLLAPSYSYVFCESSPCISFYQSRLASNLQQTQTPFWQICARD